MDGAGSGMRVFVESVRVDWSDGLRFSRGVTALGSERGGVVLSSEGGEGVMLGSKGGEGVACLDR